MLRILVAHSYFLRFDRKQRERAKPYPPLATLQVASMLRSAGHAVRVFDAMLADGVEEYQRLLAEVRPQLVVLYEDSFNFLSKMCLERMREAARTMIRTAHESGARVVAAGSDASDAPESYLHAGADVVLIGEGLAQLQSLTQRLDADVSASPGALVDGQGGVAIFTHGKLALATGRPHDPYRQLDPPAWDLIDIERYRRVWQQAHGYFSLNMASSRGCSFRCNWCAKPIWGNQYLQRDARQIASEMADLKRAFQPDHIWFADDIFGFRADWVAKFATALHTSGGAGPFSIQTRADLISPAMAGALKDAGCVEAWIGAESGSQRVLDAMHKGTTVAEIHGARTRLKDAGIRVGFFIQLGYLGEGLDDILATRELIDRAVPDDVGVSVSYPLPGTPFYDKVKAQLGSKTHWRESDDLDMMFHGTYRSEFYRLIRDLLHDCVSAHRLSASRDDEIHQQALRSLQRRWDRLLADERSYRMDRGDALAMN